MTCGDTHYHGKMASLPLKPLNNKYVSICTRHVDVTPTPATQRQSISTLLSELVWYKLTDVTLTLRHYSENVCSPFCEHLLHSHTLRCKQFPSSHPLTTLSSSNTAFRLQTSLVIINLLLSNTIQSTSTSNNNGGFITRRSVTNSQE